ncbi:MAG: hypothetical protein NTW19_03140 [Planctomycetota bacterium]|nr:hypothetical protein [Planctomycetota bacterium]
MRRFISASFRSCLNFSLFVGLFIGLFVIAGAVAPARADVAAASPFTDHMVLQRGMAVPVWGTAAAGEEVTVSFGEQKVSTKADDKGKWKVALAELKADATGRVLTIAGAANTLAFKDVLVGEVWLCSGQSNMGLEVRKVTNAAEEIAAAKDPLLRCFTARHAPGTVQGYVININSDTQRYPIMPRDTCVGKWERCTPETTNNWSGVGYFFARELRRKLDVPVGIIVSSMGATAIEGWTSVEGLKEIPAYRERAISYEELANALLADPKGHAKALEKQAARIAEQSQMWFARLDAEDVGLKAKWNEAAFDDSGWGTVKLPVSVADNPLGAPVGTVWFRSSVKIPTEWVGKNLEIELGQIDATDETFVNGTRVGRTWFDVQNYWNQSRHYDVPAAAVTGTTLQVTMRLLKLNYPMGVFGPEGDMRVTLKLEGAGPAKNIDKIALKYAAEKAAAEKLAAEKAAATQAAANGTATKPAEAKPAEVKPVEAKQDDRPSVSLAGAWKMKKAQDLDPGLQPMPAAILGKEPGNHYGHPGVEYNGLIHPIIPFAIRGAIWYQGEANAPFYVDYKSLLPGLITSWRKEWGQGDFPFGVVQLADYWGEQKHPVERAGYTPLREAQAIGASRVPNTFLATAVGVGEGGDIHPKNKQEVGRRLAMPALNQVYGMKDVQVAPVYKSMKVDGNKVTLTFANAAGLHSEGDPPVGFAVAGADRAFYWCHAKIEGETVVVWSDKVAAPVAVRYAWSTNPVCNVYNGSNLPISQFHTDDWDMSQLVITDDPVTLPSGWKRK